MAQEQDQNVAYSRELEVISQYRELSEREEISVPEAREALNNLTQLYERLLDDSKLLTSVGDRLQRKLKSANLMMREQAEEIKRVNANIQEKNLELQLTVDELTRAKASRRASALVLLGAIGLFIVSELMEDFADTYLTVNFGGNAAAIFSWTFKVLLVLLFKPAESFFEKRILESEKKRAQGNSEAKREEIKSQQQEVEILDPVQLAKKKRADARKKTREEAMARESAREKERPKVGTSTGTE